MFAHVTTSNSKYAYVVTDLAGNIPRSASGKYGEF